MILRDLLLRIRALVAPHRVERELDEELAFHIERETQKQISAGLSPVVARARALARFGPVPLAADQCRDARGLGFVDDLARETRQAARRLLRSPAFTAATVLTLALAIGANASIFALVYRVVLHPLPYGHSERLVAVEFSLPTRNVPKVYYIPSRLYFQYLDRAHTLDGLALYVATNELTLTGQGSPERIRVSRSTWSLASVLRVAPAIGRWFNETEAARVSSVAVLSHGFWVRRFGQDPNVIGRSITFDGVPTLVLGVMPAAFAFPDSRVDAWIPAPFATRTTATDSFAFAAVGRLRDGATITEARAELTRLAIDLDPSYPNNGYKALVSTATTLLDATVGRIAITLWILLASVGLVLLIACTNVANLFLVRSDVRQREIAMRRALGAGHRAIAQYFLTESTLLSVAGGVIGLGLAWGGVHMLVAFGPAVGPWWASLPRLHEVQLDGVVWAFTGALSLVTALAFGSIPLLRSTSLAEPLHESRVWSTASRSRHRTRRLLMAGQIALALVLLVASGLMLRSFQELRAVDPGFDATSTLTFRIGLPRVDYPDPGKMAAAHRAIVDHVSALPGVTAVSASTCLPLSEQQLCQGGPLFIEGHSWPPGVIAPFVAIRAVDGAYFQTMRMRILSGRGIERGDVEREEPIVVVNQALVNMAFRGQNPIGQRVRFGNPSLSRGTPEWLTVAGVVGNTPTFGLTEPAPFPQLYMPVFATRRVNMGPRLDVMSFVVRTTVTPESLADPVRRAVGEVDGNLALAHVQTLRDILERAAAQMAFTMVLLVIAAGVSLLLGIIGIYGAMSYIVSQRTGEIGVRLALGADRGSVARMIVWQGAVVASVGVAIGLTAAFAGGRVIQSLLYGVSPRDPSVFIGMTVLLLAVVLLACWLPARRAARLSPLDALRTE